MTLKQLKARVKSKPTDHGLAGFYESGSLYVNDTTGKTVFGPLQMERSFAEQFCEDLGLTLTEV